LYCAARLFGLVLTPTRELAMQVCDHLRALYKFADILVGGARASDGSAKGRHQQCARMHSKCVLFM